MNKIKKDKGLAKKHKAARQILALAVLFFSLVLPALALETGLQYGTATGLGTQDIRVTVMRIVQIFLGLVGLIALILVIYAGYLYLTSAGNAEKIETAKKVLKNAAIGLAIIFFAFSIVSFIIGVLTGTIGGGGGQPPAGPPAGCEDCGYLGGGIIESVYPAPNAKEVARNTSIMVTFKVPMDPGTICNVAQKAGGDDAKCDGDTLNSGNVLIYPQTPGESAAVSSDKIKVTSTGNKTFVFNADDYLGDGVNNIWYAVKLTSDIEKDNGDSAFPGAGGGFLWRFEIGAFLDLDPAALSDVFPQPDDSSDTYSTILARTAEGAIQLTKQPSYARAAAVADVATEAGTVNISAVAGTYNCQTDAYVCIAVAANGTITVGPKASASATTCSSANLAGHGFVVNPALSGLTLNIGCGLVVNFSVAPVAGSLWHFKAISAKTADTLSVDSKVYTFINAAPAGDQIQVGAGVSGTASNIAAEINADNLGATADAAGFIVDLTAKVAGVSGNFIPLQASGDWAALARMQGGTAFAYTPQTADKPDQPRNAVLSLTFSEPIDPTKVSADSIKVEYDNNGTWTAVSGKYLFSNNYQTVEFLADNACTDTLGQPITNSCGDKIYCLPTIEPSPYAATNYRVTVKAGLLKTCTADSDCIDPNYPSCGTFGSGFSGGCFGTFDGENVYYPKVGPVPAGVVDAANNSFNGDQSTYVFNGKTFGAAEGPEEQSAQPAYNLNTPNAGVSGDDLVWRFFINKNLDLSGPNIEAIRPTIGQADISLTAPVSATSSELLLSATLKPGSNYRDGQCACSSGNSGCPAGQTCDTTVNKCKSDLGEQTYCLEDNECSANTLKRCVNKKYVSLINRSNWQVGWWISQQGIDTSAPLDEYADKTKIFLNHTRLAEITNYGAELGSGIKDIYQNCFLPSVGPNAAGSGSCGAGPANPYCCNGVAINQASWEASACFTGY